MPHPPPHPQPLLSPTPSFKPPNPHPPLFLHELPLFLSQRRNLAPKPLHHNLLILPCLIPSSLLTNPNTHTPIQPLPPPRHSTKLFSRALSNPFPRPLNILHNLHF